jgi:hypothetical protein
MATEASGSKRAQFLALAGAAVERMFGSDAQNGLVTLAEREERACSHAHSHLKAVDRRA